MEAHRRHRPLTCPAGSRAQATPHDDRLEHHRPAFLGMDTSPQAHDPTLFSARGFFSPSSLSSNPTLLVSLDLIQTLQNLRLRFDSSSVVLVWSLVFFFFPFSGMSFIQPLPGDALTAHHVRRCVPELQGLLHMLAELNWAQCIYIFVISILTRLADYLPVHLSAGPSCRKHLLAMSKVSSAVTL